MLNIELFPASEAHGDLKPEFRREAEVHYTRIYESSVPGLVSLFIVGPGVGMRLTREQVLQVYRGLGDWLIATTPPRAAFAVDSNGVAEVLA